MWVQDLRTEPGQGVGSRPKDRAGAGCGFKTSGQSWDRVRVQDLRIELGQGVGSRPQARAWTGCGFKT